MIAGQWRGAFFYWACPGCHEERCALQAPAEDNERCARCVGLSALAGLDEVTRLLEENEAKDQRIAELEAEVSALKEMVAA